MPYKIERLEEMFPGVDFSKPIRVPESWACKACLAESNLKGKERSDFTFESEMECRQHIEAAHK